MRAWRTSIRRLATSAVLVFAATGGIVATSVAAPSNASATSVATPCPSSQPTRIGSVGGIVPLATSRRLAATNCASRVVGLATTNSPTNGQPPYYAYVGSPPLVNTPPHPSTPGPVMNGSGPVIVTPIYWQPSGYSFPDAYRALTTQFISDVAAASGSSTNVFSILTQYQPSSSLETSYDIVAGTALTDTTSYPTTGGCNHDTGSIYPDNTGYSACVTNAQIQSEVATYLAAQNLTGDVHHLYVIFLPEGVEACTGVGNGALGGTCSPNQSKSGFCGYHSYGTGLTAAQVFAVMPFAVTGGALGPACSSQDAQYADTSNVGAQSPNNNIDADSEISVMSHEISEAITDPYLSAWYDSSDAEIGDECSYIYGDSLSMQGAPGAQYNQTINGHHYFIQEEFSNSAWLTDIYYGCAQNDQASVVFDPNGGAGSMPAQFALSASNLNANTLILPGSIFNGWNTYADGLGSPYADGASYAFADSTTLYAQWQAVPPITVSFNSEGGSAVSPVSEPVSSTMNLPSAPTYPGYAFQGWFLAASGGSPLTSPYTLPVHPITFYAQWAAIPTATVTFNANGGTGSMSPETNYGTAALTKNSFTRAGYTFTSWSTVANAIGGTPYVDGGSYIFTTSETLYAQWNLVALASPVAPSPPGNLVARLSGRSLTLRWNSPTSGTSPAIYSVYERSASGGEVSIPINEEAAVTGLSAVVSAPGPGQTRYFIVTATNAGGTSPHSNEVVVTVPRTSTTTALRVAPSSVTHAKAQHVVFSVKVSSSGGATFAHGTVHILLGSKSLCTVVLSSRGTGSCHITGASQRIGRHSVVAEFVGNSSALQSKSTTRTFKVS